MWSSANAAASAASSAARNWPSRNGPGIASVGVKHTNVYCPDSQGKCKNSANARSFGTLDEGRPAIDQDVIGGTKVGHHHRCAGLRGIDARAFAECELKVLDACRDIVSGTHDATVAGFGHHGDTRTGDAEHSHTQ